MRRSVSSSATGPLPDRRALARCCPTSPDILEVYCARSADSSSATAWLLHDVLVGPMLGGMYELPDDHPGKSDPEYRARRAAISEASAAYVPDGPIADVEYSPEEDEVWAVVSRELRHKHHRFASRAYLEATERLVLPATRVPQLREVDERLSQLTGFRIRP